jgi:hypothetical protein
MKRFYNYEKIEIEEEKNYITETFKIDVPSLYGLNYFKELDAAIQAFINRIDEKQPTLIKIVGDFDVLHEASEKEIMEFVMVVVSLMIDAISLNEESDREKRYGAPKKFNNVSLTTVSKLKIINFKTKIKKFNIEVLDKKEKKLLVAF